MSAAMRGIRPLVYHSSRRHVHISRVCLRLKAGLVGLPNVGKSTIFNALVAGTGGECAVVANFPFCTIKPQDGVAPVHDDRLGVLAAIAGSKRQIPATFDITDIAGLIKGASQGEGLGNQFLANIRECSLLVHVVRCFDDPNVSHVIGGIDPARDAEVIEFELILADLQQLERTRKKRRVGGTADDIALLARVEAALTAGVPVRRLFAGTAVPPVVHELSLLTAKPVVFALNVTDMDFFRGAVKDAIQSFAAAVQSTGDSAVLLCASLDTELATLSPVRICGYRPVRDAALLFGQDEAQALLKDFGAEDITLGARRLATEAYHRLTQQTYFTIGPEEARAWTIVRGDTAPMAAGVIHSDIARGFICAEVTAYADLVRAGSLTAAKAANFLRREGKDYVMKDGDVVHFRFNVTKK